VMIRSQGFSLAEGWVLGTSPRMTLVGWARPRKRRWEEDAR
jgi:hypothetical protein